MRNKWRNDGKQGPKLQNKSDAPHRISPAYRNRMNQCLPRIRYKTGELRDHKRLCFLLTSFRSNGLSMCVCLNLVADALGHHLPMYFFLDRKETIYVSIYIFFFYTLRNIPTNKLFKRIRFV